MDDLKLGMNYSGEYVLLFLEFLGKGVTYLKNFSRSYVLTSRVSHVAQLRNCWVPSLLRAAGCLLLVRAAGCLLLVTEAGCLLLVRAAGCLLLVTEAGCLLLLTAVTGQ